MTETYDTPPEGPVPFALALTLAETDNPERLARALVDVDDRLRAFREEIIEPAKRRLGEILRRDDTPAFVTVDGRIVEPSWAGARYDVAVDSLCAAVRIAAEHAPRQMDPTTGEVESEADVVFRMMKDVFANTKPRTRDLDRVLGQPRSIAPFRRQTERGHPSVSIRRPSVPQPEE